MQLVKDFFRLLFYNLNLRRVEFKIDVHNLKSQKAIEKIGAVKEILLRNYNIQSYGASKGIYVYIILKEEWRKQSNLSFQTAFFKDPKTGIFLYL